MSRKVLIFDDDSMMRTLLSVFLKRKGFEPVVAVDGVDAVALAAEHLPALIVMDFIMPAKDGLEAIGDLRRAGVTAPVVMFTSKDVPEDRARALGAGATAYLLKPFNPAEFERVVLPLLGS
ncbi:MAG: response regulator [Elusimicrobiota bacterium]|nr:MAG: response regulator [Elusimicrobiota bacterium]